MSDDKNKTRTTMRLPAEMMKKLDAEARGLGWSRTQLVTQALAKFLAERGNATTVRVIV
jgi:predicted transcriptional regulator